MKIDYLIKTRGLNLIVLTNKRDILLCNVNKMYCGHKAMLLRRRCPYYLKKVKKQPRALTLCERKYPLHIRIVSLYVEHS